MCRDFLEHHVKGYTLRLGSCCDHNPTFESDVTIPIFKRLLMNLLAERIHSKALPEGAHFLMHMRMLMHDSAMRLKNRGVGDAETSDDPIELLLNVNMIINLSMTLTP
uniref:Uncharacterized protein n=1 Tax=Magallana gigas TaxID=29159 RepID=A0A8W8MYX0_MAGGI